MTRILLILVLLSTTALFSQQKNFEDEVSKISNEIDQITMAHKDSLKIAIKEIDLKLQSKQINVTQADALKMEIASYHAKQIEIKVSKEQDKLQQLVQDKMDGKIVSEEPDAFKVQIFDSDITIFEGNRKKKNRIHHDKRTTTQFVFAMGLNNVLIDNDVESLNTSAYKFWQSHFYEVGFTFKTRFSKKPSKTYFKYGVSFLWNNLRAKNNQYHVVYGDQTVLERYPFPLEESRLRHVQMLFPMHVEFDFSKNSNSNGEIYDRTHGSWRLGFGGFWGFKLGTRQYLEYESDQAFEVEELQKADFNMNTLNYGLSSYVAYRGLGFYVKYDLNKLFRNSETRNLSLGIRWDIN